MFITFEAVGDKLGKSTQVKLLTERLRDDGYKVTNTYEPGNTGAGTLMRKMLLDKTFNLVPIAELLLFNADRAQHYHEVIKPSLDKGKIVLCDRFIDSTLVYQGKGRGYDNDFLWYLHELATGGILPDLTFVLHGQPHGELEQSDTFESETDDFHERVRDGMMELTKTHERFVLIDANRSVREISDEIYDIVIQKLGDSNATTN